jgi:NhaP-type Na+/H+ or K+/H+ antiporter
LLGWIAAGVVLGPQAIGALRVEELAALHPVLEVAAGVVLFQLGQRVDPSWLRRNPWLLGTSVLESALAFAAMYGVLLYIGAPPLVAAVAAAIGTATAPAVVLTLARELRAQGQVTERMLLLSALNSIYAFIAVNVLLAWLALEHAGDWRAIALHPLYLILGSLALAGVLAAATLGLLRLLGRREETQFIGVLALIVIAVWAAGTLKLSLVLTLLSYGVLTRLLDRRRLFITLSFGRIGTILLILLFSLTAASLDLSLLPAGALAGAALIAARFAGKALGVLALAARSGLVLRKAGLLALALTPMSAIAVVLVQQTSAHYPEFGALLATVVISAIVMLELLGPLLAHFALVRAGEAAEERA